MALKLRLWATAAGLAVGVSGAAAMEPQAGPAQAPGDDALKAYCGALANNLADAEKSAQALALSELEDKLQKRIAELTAKQAELSELVRKRDEMARRADATLVDIYGKMKPESAAAQIAAMEEGIAVALLSKLSTRTASAILNEIQAERAARLTEAMAMAGGKTPQKKS